MISPTTIPKLKHQIATNGQWVAVCLLMISVIAALTVLTGLYSAPIAASPIADPPPDPEPPETPDPQLLTITSQHSTVITENTSAYEQGEYLENNHLYPLANSQPLNYTVSIETDNIQLDSVYLELNYTATERRDTGTVFWSDSLPLAGAQSFSDDDRVQVSTSIDMNDVIDFISVVRDEFGSGTDVSAAIETSIVYRHTDETGVTRTETKTIEDDITILEQLYGVTRYGNSVDHTPPAHNPSTSISENDPFISNTSFILLGFLSFFGGLGAIVGYIKLDPDEMQTEIDQMRYSAWVTEVESVNLHQAHMPAPVSSLDDLINLAIDIQERVLYVKSIDEYVVIDDDLVFTYLPNQTGSNVSRLTNFGMSDAQFSTDNAAQEIDHFSQIDVDDLGELEFGKIE